MSKIANKLQTFTVVTVFKQKMVSYQISLIFFKKEYIRKTFV